MISSEVSRRGTDVLLKERLPIMLKMSSIMKNKGKDIGNCCHLSNRDSHFSVQYVGKETAVSMCYLRSLSLALVYQGN